MIPRTDTMKPKKSIQQLTSILCAALFILALCSPTAYAVDRRGRLGVGLSNQLQLQDLPAISLRLQTASSTSIGALFGANTKDDGGLGAGFKIQKHFFEEPQLNFYGSFLGAYLNQKNPQTSDDSGFQFDFTLGSEFHFRGLESLGLHFEFGVSLTKLDDFVIQTVGQQFIVMGIHFYL